MSSRENAFFTQYNNVLGHLNLLYAIKEHCPSAHLIKLGSLGEYGTPPGTIIPEGYFPDGAVWRTAEDSDKVYDLSGRMFPRDAGSWYHQSKVHDTHNTAFACKLWGLRCTDIMQGVVYGTRPVLAIQEPPELHTRFDFDEQFGTAINRFVAQAVAGHPLTVYGTGEQIRGFLPLQDSMACLLLAIENAASEGEYRVFNQFAQTYSIADLAEVVATCAAEIGIDADIQAIENPRKEAASHMYAPDGQRLRDLGYKPTDDPYETVCCMLEDLRPHAKRIEEHKAALMPNIRWTK